MTYTKFWLLLEDLAGWYFGGRYGRLDFNCTMSSTALGKSEKKIQKNPKQIRYKCTHNWQNLTCENMKGKTYKKLTNQILGSHIQILEKINLFEEGVCFVEYPIRQFFWDKVLVTLYFQHSFLFDLCIYVPVSLCMLCHDRFRLRNIKWAAQRNWFTAKNVY